MLADNYKTSWIRSSLCCMHG